MTTPADDDVELSADELTRLIERGYESIDFDYKGPGNWATWTAEEKAELLRDMMGMGNGDRPGWLVIGVSEGENGGWRYDGLTNDQVASFDPTDIGLTARRYCDPELRFSIHSVESKGRRFIVVRIPPFTDVPYVCRAACGKVLTQGGFYVRTAACQTVQVQTAEQMRRIIDRATQVHANSIANKIEYFINRSREGAAAAPPPTEDREAFQSILEEMRRRAGGK